MAQDIDLSAAVPATIWTPTQGLIVNLSPTQIPPTACQACYNFVGFEGKLRRRAGWNLILAQIPAGYSVNCHTVRFALDGTQERVVVARKLSDNSGKFLKWTGAAWSDLTGALSFSCDPVLRTRATCLFGVLYFATGVSNLIQWTGGAANPTFVINANPAIEPWAIPLELAAWDNRLWMGNVVDQLDANSIHPARMAWSDFQSPTVWRVSAPNSGSAGFQDIEDSTYTAPIVGMIDTRNYMFAFQQDSTYYGAPAANIFYGFQRLSRGIGLAAKATLKRFRETLFWLGNEAVYGCADQQTLQPLSDAIQARILQVCDQTKFNQAIACLDPFKQLYWLFLPKSGSSNVQYIFIYSIRDNSWWEGEMAQGTAINPECTFEFRKGAWQVEVTIGSQDGKIYQMEGYPAVALDGGTAFTTSWRSSRADAVGVGGSLALRNQGAAGPFETMSVQRFAGHAASGSLKVTPYYGSGAHNMTPGKAKTVTFATKSDNFVTFEPEANRFTELVLSHPDITNAPELEGFTTHIMRRGQVPRL